MKKVSVIVPVYHVAAYLRQCVDSILNQTYSNIEVVLVDDGGDDECPELCDYYANIDNRVKCIHKVNEGQSMARKDGLYASTGDYIMYVDADDWIDVNTIELCVGTAETKSADIVMFGYKRIYPKNTFTTFLFDSDKEFVNDDVKILHRRMIGMVGEELKHVEDFDRLVTMWGKLYSRENAMNGLWISERKTGSLEDAVYNLGAFEKCNRCVYINYNLYNYRKDNDTSTTKRYRDNLLEQWYFLYGYLSSFIENNSLGDEYVAALNNRIVHGMLGLGLNELSSSKTFNQKAKTLKSILNQEQWKQAYQQLDLKCFSIKWKVFFGLCKYRMTGLVVFLLNLINYLRSVIPD